MREAEEGGNTNECFVYKLYLFCFVFKKQKRNMRIRKRCSERDMGSVCVLTEMKRNKNENENRQLISGQNGMCSVVSATRHERGAHERGGGGGRDVGEDGVVNATDSGAEPGEAR